MKFWDVFRRNSWNLWHDQMKISISRINYLAEWFWELKSKFLWYFVCSHMASFSTIDVQKRNKALIDLLWILSFLNLSVFFLKTKALLSWIFIHPVFRLLKYKNISIKNFVFEKFSKNFLENVEYFISIFHF